MSKYRVGAYIRLSRDDKYSEYDSIDNQKQIIEQFIKGHSDFELVNNDIINLQSFQKTSINYKRGDYFMKNSNFTSTFKKSKTVKK